MRLLVFLALLFVVPMSSAYAASANRGGSGSENEDGVSLTDQEINRWSVISKDFSPSYEAMVMDLRSGKKDMRLGVSALRTYYPYTRSYTPFSDKIIDEMVGYAYIVDTSDDNVAVNRALANYRDLLNKHMANLGVVSYALTLSRLDVRFGDDLFLRKIRDTIRNSWSGRGNIGSEPQHPYKVVTFAEEEYILSTYGGEVVKSDIYKVSKQFFDVRDVVDDNGDYIQIYFDVSVPIRNVAMIKAVREKEQKTVIPLQ